MITKIQKTFTNIIGLNFLNRIGGKQWLIEKELQYGGMHINVPRNKVSPHDPRTQDEISVGGMIGGDRMLYHGYAKYYENYLRQYICSRRPITLVEVGILKGVGLSIWCDLFPSSRIIGLDIDLEHFRGNRCFLESKGAFMINSPEVYEFDQFVDNRNKMGEILGNDSIDIFIDDGFHSVDSITNTISSVKDYLSEKFVYFIEDNTCIGEIIKNSYHEYNVQSHGELSVLTRKI